MLLALRVKPSSFFSKSTKINGKGCHIKISSKAAKHYLKPTISTRWHSDEVNPNPIQTTRFQMKDGKRIYSRSEVGRHNTPQDSWVVIGDKVYNISSWLDYHPGGANVLLQRAGTDVTDDFYKQSHSYRALEVLETLHIGYVETKKRYSLEPEYDAGNLDKE